MLLKLDIIKVFENHNIKINDSQAEKLAEFNNLMQEYNKIHNLTSITDDSEVLYKHLLDSVLPIDLMEDNSKIIDIGCGAGFPSVPLAILNPNLKITAIDSVGKKTEFVKIAKNKLNLDNLEVIHTRIEDLANNKDYRESFDYVVSRAVASLPTILEYSAPFLKNNGKILSYKGSNYKSEVDISNNALNKLNCRINKVYEYNIAELELKRYVLSIEKFDFIAKTYPRKQNKPRLQPL